MAVEYGIAIKVDTSASTLNNFADWNSIRPKYLCNTDGVFVTLNANDWLPNIVYWNGYYYALYPIDSSLWYPYNVEEEWVHNDTSNTSPSSYYANVENFADVYILDNDTPLQDYYQNHYIPFYKFNPYWEFWRNTIDSTLY